MGEMVIRNATGAVIASKPVTVISITAGCATAAAGAGMWMYDRLITHPLRVFYFTGAVWGDKDPVDICAQITGIPGAWWAESPDHMATCMDLLERKFRSWNANVTTVVWFTLLTFVVMQLMCTCCCVRPLIREFARNR